MATSFEAPSRSSSVPPLLGGRYRLGRRLGKGGMGVVHLAEDIEVGRRVAIKQLRVDPETQPDLLARFGVEATAQARVEHPHLVRIFECNLEARPPYLAMEYVDGVDLETLIRRRGALAPLEAVRWVRQVAEAVAALHEQGILHRDLKPANILLRSADGQPVVMDLGLALLDDGPKITATGAFVGTPVYLPPEVINASEWGPAADQYQLGAILYELLTGDSLVQGRNLEELLVAASGDKQVVLEGVPATLQSLVRKAVRSNPRGRHRDLASFAQALQALEVELELEASKASPAPAPPARPRAERPALPAGGRPREPPRPPARSFRHGALPLLAGVACGVAAVLLWRGGGARPQEVRWRVVGDALVLDLDPGAAHGFVVRLDDQPRPTESRPGPRGLRLLVRGLDRGRTLSGQLTWQGGAGPRVSLDAQVPALQVRPRVTPGPALELAVQRPCRARWKVSGAASGDGQRLSPGLVSLPLPPDPPARLELLWEEEGVEFSQEVDLSGLLDEAFRRLLERTREAPIRDTLASRVGARQAPHQSFEELRDAWRPLLAWLPRRLLASPGGTRSPLGRQWERVQRSVPQERLLGEPARDLELPPGEVGARLSALPPGVARWVETTRSRLGPGTGGVSQSSPPEFRLTERREALVPTDQHLRSALGVEVRWDPEALRGARTVWVSVGVRKLSPWTLLSLELPGQLGAAGTVAHLWTRVRDPEQPRFDGWLSLKLPVSSLPGDGRLEVSLRSMLAAWPVTAWVGEVRLGVPAPG